MDNVSVELDRARPGARFARIFQHSKEKPGGLAQRLTVVKAFTPKEYGDHFDRLLLRLDRAVNEGGRSFLTVEYHDGMSVPGVASVAGFSLSTAMHPAGTHEVARHEFGHIVDFWLLNDEQRHWFIKERGIGTTWPGTWEAWAEAVREWLDGGWQALTPVLLPDV